MTHEFLLEIQARLPGRGPEDSAGLETGSSNVVYNVASKILIWHKIVILTQSDTGKGKWNNLSSTGVTKWQLLLLLTA